MNGNFSNLFVWKNGTILSWQDATIPIMSHGLSRGSAIFELFDIYSISSGVYAFRLDKHVDRLFQSAKLLDTEFGFSRHEIEDAITETVGRNKISCGLVKIIAFFEEESMTDLLLLDSKLCVAVFAVPHKLEKCFNKSRFIDACFSRWRKIREDMVPNKVKACANYLNGMLVLKDAINKGYDLGILLDVDGNVAEGPTESIFMVENNILKTPPLDGILPGITRMSIIEAAQVYGICTSEEKITPQKLMEADEIFTCKSTAKVLPLKQIEDRRLKDPPGPVTKKIMKVMDKICSGNSESFRDWLQPLLIEPQV